MPDSISCPSGGHQPRETKQPWPDPPPSGGSAVKPPPLVTDIIAETRAKIGLYEALTALVVGITPAAIALAGILTEAAKKDTKS